MRRVMRARWFPSLLAMGVVLAAASGPAAEARPHPWTEVGTTEEIDAPSVRRTSTAGVDALPGAVQRVATDAVNVARQSPAVFFGLFVAGILFFVPGSTFTIAAGLSYGVWVGLLVSVAASAIAAAIHFSLARYLFGDPVRRRLRGQTRLEALDRALTREGWKIVGLTRASALIPGAVQSCLYALTSVPFRSHLLATVVGLIPPTLFYVVVGAAGGDFLVPGGGALARSAVWALFLVPIAIVLWYLTHKARQAMRGSGDSAPASPRRHRARG